jgi:hypothetical protein
MEGGHGGVVRAEGGLTDGQDPLADLAEQSSTSRRSGPWLVPEGRPAGRVRGAQVLAKNSCGYRSVRRWQPP